MGSAHSRRSRVTVMEHEIEVWDEYFADADAETESSSLGDVILALENLTERQRFVIECRYCLRPGQEEPLTLRDIATLMGVSFQAVYDAEQHALARLRQVLDTSTPK